MIRAVHARPDIGTISIEDLATFVKTQEYALGIASGTAPAVAPPLNRLLRRIPAAATPREPARGRRARAARNADAA